MSETLGDLWGTVERDESPHAELVTGDYDPQYPGSTPNAPYGFKPNGEPYARHHGKRSGNKSASKQSVGSAKSAANMLGQMNLLVALSLGAFGLPQTSESIMEANEQFVAMAEQALASDPALCRRILSAGTSSGKAALVMAYASLGMAIYPVATKELKQRKLEREIENGLSD